MPSNREDFSAELLSESRMIIEVTDNQNEKFFIGLREFISRVFEILAEQNKNVLNKNILICEIVNENDISKPIQVFYNPKTKSFLTDNLDGLMRDREILNWGVKKYGFDFITDKKTRLNLFDDLQFQFLLLRRYRDFQLILDKMQGEIKEKAAAESQKPVGGVAIPITPKRKKDKKASKVSGELSDHPEEKLVGSSVSPLKNFNTLILEGGYTHTFNYEPSSCSITINSKDKITGKENKKTFMAAELLDAFEQRYHADRAERGAVTRFFSFIFTRNSLKRAADPRPLYKRWFSRAEPPKKSVEDQVLYLLEHAKNNPTSNTAAAFKSLLDRVTNEEVAREESKKLQEENAKAEADLIRHLEIVSPLGMNKKTGKYEDFGTPEKRIEFEEKQALDDLSKSMLNETAALISDFKKAHANLSAVEAAKAQEQAVREKLVREAEGALQSVMQQALDAKREAEEKLRQRQILEAREKMDADNISARFQKIVSGPLETLFNQSNGLRIQLQNHFYNDLTDIIINRDDRLLSKNRFIFTMPLLAEFEKAINSKATQMATTKRLIGSTLDNNKKDQIVAQFRGDYGTLLTLMKKFEKVLDIPAPEVVSPKSYADITNKVVELTAFLAQQISFNTHLSENFKNILVSLREDLQTVSENWAVNGVSRYQNDLETRSKSAPVSASTTPRKESEPPSPIGSFASESVGDVRSRSGSVDSGYDALIKHSFSGAFPPASRGGSPDVDEMKKREAEISPSPEPDSPIRKP